MKMRPHVGPWLAALLVLGLAGLAAVVWLNKTYLSDPWLEEGWCLDIPPSSSAEAATLAWPQTLSNHALGRRVVDVLEARGWTDRVRPGRYCFQPTESAKASAERLATGTRETVRMVVPAGRDLPPIAGAMARNLHADSAEVLARITADSVRWRIVPNTYDMWWETDADGVVSRVLREHAQWWTEDRRAAANAVGLSPFEVTVLASIVQAETASLSEAPVVAGLYLNRLRKGMPLQADPTLIYALNDPSIRRVLDVHKEVDSPYNTYLHTGLPPGPIRVVDPRYLQSVLHPASHTFLYMCAEPGGSGTHNFASTYREHLRNARAYQRWLNEQRIYR